MKDLLEESSIEERAAIKDLPYVCKDILAHYEYFRMHETHEYFNKNIEWYMSLYIDEELSLQERYDKLNKDHQRVLAEYYRDSVDFHKQIIQLKDELAEAKLALQNQSLKERK